MKRAGFLFMVVWFFASCSGEEKKKPVSSSGVPFKSEKILIDTTFPPFESDSISLVLEQIGVCLATADTTLPDSIQLPLCRHDWFRIFRNTKNPSWRAGFILEIKEGIYSHVPQVINVVPAGNGKFKVTNSYKGELLEMRTTPGGCFDLIIRYIDSAIGTLAILHEWNNNKYIPVTVVEINDRFVKEEKMDSLNNIYIDNFVWGY